MEARWMNRLLAILHEKRRQPLLPALLIWIQTHAPVETSLGLLVARAPLRPMN